MKPIYTLCTERIAPAFDALDEPDNTADEVEDPRGLYCRDVLAA